MIFLSDENIAVRAALLLQALDGSNKYLGFTDHFQRGTWPEKPFLICADGRILKNAVERTALRTSCCTFIYLGSGWTNLPWNAYALSLVRYWPDVLEMISKSAHPTLIELPRNGKVTRSKI